MAGLLAKLWSLVRSKEIVGRDKTGNVFYRQSIRSDGLVKERRWVEYKSNPDPNNLPVEWYSWLTGRRKEVPTPEEIIALEAHRKLVKMNVAIRRISHKSSCLKLKVVQKEEVKRRFRSRSLQQDALNDELRPPDMNSFIKQVAALEGDKFDGGEGSFIVDGITGAPAFIEQTDSLNTKHTSDESPIQPQDEDMVTKSKGKTNVYEKWIPPN